MQQDYIMRMIQQMTGFLVRVLLLRKQGKTEEALAVLTDAYGRLSGLSGSLVHALSEEDLIELLQARGGLNPDRCLALAELLRAEGHVYDDVERFDESYPRYLKALRLYLELRNDADDLPPGLDLSGLDDVIEQLSDYDLPIPTRDRLIAYLEFAGRFDEAENLLLDRLETAGGDEVVTDALVLFYRRLLLKSDSALETGGLPREEVEEGLARAQATAD